MEHFLSQVSRQNPRTEFERQNFPVYFLGVSLVILHLACSASADVGSSSFRFSDQQRSYMIPKWLLNELLASLFPKTKITKKKKNDTSQGGKFTFLILRKLSLLFYTLFPFVFWTQTFLLKSLFLFHCIHSCPRNQKNCSIFSDVRKCIKCIQIDGYHPFIFIFMFIFIYMKEKFLSLHCVLRMF